MNGDIQWAMSAAVMALAAICLIAAIIYNQIRTRARCRLAIDDTRRQTALHKTVVSQASFDIRSALMAIMGYCDLPLGSEALAQDRLTSIRRQTAQIMGAIDGILDAPGATMPGALTSTSAPAPAEPRFSARILLAEDDPHLQQVIKFYVESAGAQVTIAADGQRAYQQAMLAYEQEMPFDLILMDVQMPKFDGRDATIMLRDAGYTGPIVALTANATEQEQRRCMAAGCSGFLTKPVDQNEILRTIRLYAKSKLSTIPVGAISAGAGESDLVEDSQIQDLRASFRADIPSRIAEIEIAVAANNFPRVADLAHQLKGTAACFGLREFSESAHALQTAAELPEPGKPTQECFRALAEQGLPPTAAKAA